MSAWKCYIPTAAFGLSTIACIMGANALNSRKQAALTSAYALINQSYKEYKDKLKELYGEEAHNAIVDSIVSEKCIETTEEVIENTGMSKGIKIAAGVGLSVIVGFVVYKYVAKPVIANIKTQIELKKMAAEEKTIIVDEADVSTEEN